MMYKKILIFLIACIIILGCVLITFSILSKETENVSNNVALAEVTSNTENVQHDIVQDNTNQEQENVIEKSNTLQEDNAKINDIQQNNNLESQNTVNNAVKNKKIKSEEDSSINQESKKSKDQIATDLAKNEWGEDQSVYYTIDRSSGDKYYICVRSKETTETLAEYEVDIVKKTVEIK